MLRHSIKRESLGISALTKSAMESSHLKDWRCSAPMGHFDGFGWSFSSPFFFFLLQTGLNEWSFGFRRYGYGQDRCCPTYFFSLAAAK